MKKASFLILGFILIFLSSFAQEESIDSLLKKINELEISKQYDSCLKLLSPYIITYNKNWFKISKQVIYLNEKLYKAQCNLNIFRKGHELGYFYLIHPALPKFKPYKAFPEFDTIARTDMLLREEALNKSKTIYELEMPKNYSAAKDYPLCFIFHGGGSSLKKVKQHWHSAKLDSAYIKIYLQSYRHYDSETYGWRSGDKRADDDIRAIFGELIEKYRVNTSNVIVAGISAGGTYAVDIAIRQVIPVSAFIAFCPGIPDEMDMDKFQGRKITSLKGYIVGGEHDYYLPKQRQLTELFDKEGLLYRHIIIKNMGHHYPDNESNYLNNAIVFLTRPSHGK